MTNEEKKKIYQQLAAPFPEHCIQRTEGRLTGRGYDTSGIGYQFIANRLNEVLGVGGWRAHRTVNVKEIVRSNGPPGLRGDLRHHPGARRVGRRGLRGLRRVAGRRRPPRQLRGGRQEGRVHQRPSRRRRRSSASAGRPTRASLDDDNVPAEHSSDGFTVSTLPTQRPAPAPAPVVQVQPAQQVPQQPRPPPAPSRNRLTSKQLGAIQAIGRKLGLDQAGLRAATKQRFNSQPEFLSRDQASQLISAMSAQAGNGQAHEQHEPGVEG